MTLVEVLIVITALVIVVAVFIPRQAHPSTASQINCMMNIKQIDFAFLMDAEDNSRRFTIQTPVTNGGTMEFLDRNQTFPHYQKLSKYLPDLLVFVCPADKTRHAADNYEHLTDNNLSYFLNADVSTNNPSKSIMVGDRHLQANGKPVGHGTFTVRTNMFLTWTAEMHRGNGILGFADGHTETCRPYNLNLVIQSQAFAATHLSIP